MKKIYLFIILILLPVLIMDYSIDNNTKPITIKKDDVFNNNHKIVHIKFKKYNNNIDTSTILKFVEVCDSFEILDYITTLTAQICYESRARQFDKNGDVTLSSGNAQGICQVTPRTAYHYLNSVVSKNDTMLFRLGGTQYCHILECDESCRRENVIKWLSSETNNLIIYGYIMGNSMNRYKSIKRSLVDYSKGRGFLIRNENLINIDTLKYVRTIKKIEQSH